MNDLISVIVPVYNTGIYLESCIMSIVKQDYPMLEIIIVDDGSDDEFTLSKCEELQQRFNNIVVVHQINGGSASARNLGIKISKGKYIGFVDSDDTIESDMYSSLYRDLKYYNVRVAIGGIATEENGKPVGIDYSVSSGLYDNYNLLHYFFLGQWHSACTILYDRSLFDEFAFPVNEVNEDYLLNYRIFRNLDSVYYNSKVFYHYIRREGSNTYSPISIRFVDWLKHTELVLQEQSGHDSLRIEAEYQYLYSNIVLCNKALLTLSHQNSEDAEKIYCICSKNLSDNRLMIGRNKFLRSRNKMMARMISFSPSFYKSGVLLALKCKLI